MIDCESLSNNILNSDNNFNITKVTSKKFLFYCFLHEKIQDQFSSSENVLVLM